jgi:DnaD/phage-associated family protein
MNNNHSSFFYMNSIAQNWHDKNIATEEEAKVESTVHSKTYYAVVKAFGINGRHLNTREQGYLNKWVQTYHFSDDLISEACERALSNTGKVSFAYAEKILNDWHLNGIKNLNDVKKKDALKKNIKPKASVQKTTSFANFTERSTTEEELLELERKLLQ